MNKNAEFEFLQHSMETFDKQIAKTDTAMQYPGIAYKMCSFFLLLKKRPVFRTCSCLLGKTCV
jgi:hypothetical protein